MFVTLKPVRMLGRVWVGRGVQGVCRVGPWEVGKKEGKEACFSGMGGCPESQRREGGNRCP